MQVLGNVSPEVTQYGQVLGSEADEGLRVIRGRCEYFCERVVRQAYMHLCGYFVQRNGESEVGALLQYTGLFPVFNQYPLLGKRHIGSCTQCLGDPQTKGFLAGLVRCYMQGMCC